MLPRLLPGHLTDIRALWARPLISAFTRAMLLDVNLLWYTDRQTSMGEKKSITEFSLQNGQDDPDVVQVTLGTNDRRFGFSVVGGLEEGFPPRIDEIAPGNRRTKKDGKKK